MKKAPTARQLEILDFIRTFSAEKRMPPTLTEIAENFNIRPSSAAYHLKALSRKGCLSRTNGSRSITFDDQTMPCRRKDCLRRVDLGFSNTGEENAGYSPDMAANSSFFLSDHLLELCPAEQFLLFRQPDDSMFERGIHQNDLVLAVPLRFKQPQPGDLVLAQLPDGSTVVRSYFNYSAKQFELVPANNDFQSVKRCFSSNIIQGVVVALQRTF